MNRYTKYIFCVVALLLFLTGTAFTVFPFCSYVVRHFILHEEPTTDAELEGTGSPAFDVPLEEAYPFTAEAKAAIEEVKKPQTTSTPSLLSRLTSKMKAAIKKVERYAVVQNKLQSPCNKLAGFFYRHTGKVLIEDNETDVYRLDNDFLLYTNKSSVPKDKYVYLTDFARWTKEQGSPLLYIEPLSKNDDTLFEYPSNLKTGYGKMSQYFFSYLTEQQIPYFDTKSFLIAKDADPFDWVYRTDHHWNVRAGIAVAEETLRILKEDFHLDVDPSACDIANYKSVIYPEAYLGSMGQKVTLGYTSREDFEVLYPTFETNFHVETSKKDVTGPFEDTIIDQSMLDADKIAQDETHHTYGAFLYDDLDLIRVTNHTVHNGVRLLVLKQSKANVVDPYLACGVEYLDVIDPRAFHGSIRSFIEQTKPNAVLICATYPGVTSASVDWILK